jgi:hypothetical protein
MSIKKCFWVVVFSGLSQLSEAACFTASQLTTLAQNEQAFLLNRIPPAFAHALADQQITISVIEASTENPCKANLQLSVPAAHLEEANKVLDADPAKKIMLAAQGYAIPEVTQLQALFSADPNTLQIPASEALQVTELGRLRATVEMMYSLITQARANKIESTQNTVPWSAAYQQANATQCAEKRVAQSGQDILQACACRVKELSAKVSERQMEYIDYVRSNPYAMATGSSQEYANLEKQAHLACGVVTK